MATISVILPVYNGSDHILRAIRSIQQQTETDWEMIIIDDGSTDDTAAVLARESRTDKRLQILGHDERQGITAALNHGLEAASGSYVARMDADDVSHPERLRRQRLFLDANHAIGLVSCRTAFAGNAKEQGGYAEYVKWINTLLTPEQIALNRFVESPLPHPSVFFRKELTAHFGSYREGPFPEDYELWLRWLEAGVKMAKLPEVLLSWYDTPGRLSRLDRRYSVKAFYHCKSLYLAHWLQQNNPHHPDIVVWGAGRTTRKRAEMLTEHGIRICAYIDIDPRKIGQCIHNRPVLNADDVPAPGEQFIVSYVGSRGAREDIRDRLHLRNYREGLHFIMAA